MPVCSRIALDQSGRWLEDQFRRDGDGAFEASINRALVGEEAVDPLRCLPMRLIGLEGELGVNAPDDQNTVFHFDLAHCF